MSSRSTADIEIALLAAGLSRRMGTVNKLLVDFNGVPLIRHMAELYLQASPQVMIVLGHEADAVRQALAGMPIRFVINEAYGNGQQSSVQAAFAAAALDGPGLMIALGDQPALTTADIRAVTTYFLDHAAGKILVPYFDGQRGNPVIFPPAIAREIRAGDLPARRFIDTHPERVATYPAPNNHFTIDMDTAADLVRMQAHFKSAADRD